jgi:hypothetical protein
MRHRGGLASGTRLLLAERRDAYQLRQPPLLGIDLLPCRGNQSGAPDDVVQCPTVTGTGRDECRGTQHERIRGRQRQRAVGRADGDRQITGRVGSDREPQERARLVRIAQDRLCKLFGGGVVLLPLQRERTGMVVRPVEARRQAYRRIESDSRQIERLRGGLIELVAQAVQQVEVAVPWIGAQLSGQRRACSHRISGAQGLGGALQWRAGRQRDD